MDETIGGHKRKYLFDESTRFIKINMLEDEAYISIIEQNINTALERKREKLEMQREKMKSKDPDDIVLTKEEEAKIIADEKNMEEALGLLGGIS